MQLLRASSAYDYKARVLPFLSQDPFAFNLALHIISNLDEKSFQNQGSVFGWVQEDQHVVGVFWCSREGMPLGIATKRIDVGQFITTEYLYKTQNLYSRIVGIPEVINAVALMYTQKFHQEIVDQLALYGYIANEIVSLPQSGKARLATSADIATLIPWMQAFRQECRIPVSSAEQTQKQLELLIKKNELWVYEKDQNLVSMCTCSFLVSSEEKRLYRIAAVYTPPLHRNLGYASQLVSEACLSHKKENPNTGFLLYADVTNPISNKIYQKIGFRYSFDLLEIIMKEKNKS